ncbi:MurT ligase domain-containing protein [Compostimonas suwonensis]|uniref:Lipid II isoglutaminyl synthase (glutamine-hydrolyzing) subunit MurT n=1 Tax=Compostimonas suwonensis TaxID=1048394 RepID=A0A2M9BBL5_9MICO|nr:MurT ligase domain-containing protein [Compostimonas suwonensis]PJJ55329.1 uncharacterized protein DUF1727 [Compostimonas suwonensis]
MRYAPAVIIGRAVRAAARIRKPGGGSAVPGLVVNKLAPGYLAHALNSFPRGLVIVSGSSGKSTTTKMLVSVLRAHGIRIFTNPSTANISQGLTSALLEQADVRGRIDAELGVLEMDEGHGALIADRLTPSVVVLTNVMIDQIDRFHDPQMVQGMLAKIARRASAAVVLNADDQSLLELASGLRGTAEARWFGVSHGVRVANPRGFGYAETAPEASAVTAETVVERVDGARTTITVAGEAMDVALPSRGVHYAVDAAAALSAAREILGDGFEPARAIEAIGAMEPVFGRGETTTVRGRKVEFVLVQNPASFQLNVDSLPAGTEQIMVAIGSDVRDPSYLWPVDTASLGRVRVVSGSQAQEIALQLAYDGVSIDRIEENLATALDDFLALPEPSSGGGVKTVIFSADSMRRTRAHLGLTSNSDGAGGAGSSTSTGGAGV